MSKLAVDLFYDVISPYAWLSLEMLCRYRNQWKSMELKLKPFFLGAVLKESKNSGPMMVPNKAKYMIKDWERINQFYKVPINFPANFPQLALRGMGSLNAQRFVTAVDMITEGKGTEDISRQLFLRMYKTHQDITLEESFKDAGIKAKLDKQVIDKAIESMAQPHVKERLKNYTTEAIELGSFGAPTIVVQTPKGPELVFGSDRMEIIAHLLGEKYIGPLEQFSKL